MTLFVERDARSHGDIDIGVFRSELKACLGAIGIGRVFLCIRGKHCLWNGGDIPEEVYDIWISDHNRKHWVLQIMVFDDEGDRVFYRRDRRISWSKAHHAINVRGTRVLNPFVTFLFKTNKPMLEGKEVLDVMQLIAKGAELSSID